MFTNIFGNVFMGSLPAELVPADMKLFWPKSIRQKLRTHDVNFGDAIYPSVRQSIGLWIRLSLTKTKSEVRSRAYCAPAE